MGKGINEDVEDCCDIDGMIQNCRCTKIYMCQLKKRFEKWKDWLSGDDPNSIRNQIHEMLSDAAVYYTINEARRYAVDQDGNPQLNEAVHSLIKRCFLKTQTLSIRKLIDKRSDVISLVSLINDMKQHHGLLTRGKIIDAMKLSTQQKKLHSENIHKRLDLVTGAAPASRKDNDRIRICTFEKLKQRLEKCVPICNLVNKIVAHAATQESRGKVDEKDLKTSLGRIHMAHARICKVAAFMGQVLLYDSFGWSNFLPVYAGDYFEHFEKPWATKKTICKLKEFWDKYKEKTEKWSSNRDWSKDQSLYVNCRLK